MDLSFGQQHAGHWDWLCLALCLQRAIASPFPVYASIAFRVLSVIQYFFKYRGNGFTFTISSADIDDRDFESPDNLILFGHKTKVVLNIIKTPSVGTKLGLVCEDVARDEVFWIAVAFAVGILQLHRYIARHLECSG